jgi:tetratricopeptide (TPR) repeat protein
MASRGGILISGVALALAVMILIQGGAAGSAGLGYFPNLAWVWSRHKVPCGVMDPSFFGPYLSPIFRLPWLLSFALVGPIALVTAWKERRRAPLLGGYLLCVTLALAATPVCDRTRLALLPAVLPLVGRGVDEFLLAFDQASARAGAWLGAALAEVARKHGGILVALALAAAFVNVPPAQRARPPAGMGWWIVARAYLQAENPREAQAAFDRAEQSGFRSSAFYAEWGKLEYEKRLGILAAQHLLTAIQLDPRNGPAHESLGDVYATREDFDLAGQEYAVAAGLIPARAAELDTRSGEAYLDGSSPERARAMFQRALREVPGYEAALAGLKRIANPAPASRPVRMFEPLTP